MRASTSYQKPIKMQRVFSCPSASLPPLFMPAKPLSLPIKYTARQQISQWQPLVATASLSDPATVDYSSMNSVFPAEACETVGGEACDVEMFPEVTLKPEKEGTRQTSEPVDREYLEYDSPKTVFPGEACDDLGGEFCEPEYQKGVYKDI